MLTAIEVENVRIFEGSGWKFPLAALTAFCGTNSSGKSTLLKLLPMLHQTTSYRESRVWREGKLKFSGSQVDMGSYKSLVSHNDISRNLSVTVYASAQITLSAYNQLKNPDDKMQKKDELSSDSKGKKTRREFPCTIKARLVFSSVSPEKANNEEDIEQNDGLSEAEFSIIEDEVVLLQWQIKAQKPSALSPYKIVMPKNYFEKVGGLTIIDVPNLEDDKQDIELCVMMRGILPQYLYAQVKSNSPQTSKAKRLNQPYRPLPLPPQIEFANQALTQALAIDYIAPLRTPAKRYHIVSMDANLTMDAAGEFLPFILKNKSFRNKTVKNVRLKKVAGKSETLTDSVNYWLHYLRTGKDIESLHTKSREIQIVTTKDILVEFKLKSSNGQEFHAMADSGFGYSQVLPILIRGLLMDEGGTLIIEQPELHLNPALQVRLVDFFISLIYAGKQVVIETHSEHIINMLRVLVAEGANAGLDSRCAIYFLDGEGNKPKIFGMNIRADGSVPNWPKQFFGEALSLSGRLLRAQRLPSQKSHN